MIVFALPSPYKLAGPGEGLKAQSWAPTSKGPIPALTCLCDLNSSILLYLNFLIYKMGVALALASQKVLNQHTKDALVPGHAHYEGGC